MMYFFLGKYKMSFVNIGLNLVFNIGLNSVFNRKLTNAGDCREGFSGKRTTVASGT